jgi:uncharacterized protein GlcG (DUF336 family)
MSFVSIVAYQAMFVTLQFTPRPGHPFRFYPFLEPFPKEIVMSSSTIPKTVATASISQTSANALIAAAREAAKDTGIEVTIAVTDAAGHLKAFDRSDKAPFLSVDVAINKAWTAASFGLATHVWNALVQNSEVAPLAHHPRVVAVGGGCPVTDGGQVVGGIGVSGGNALQDQQVAEIALKALGFELAA